MDDAVPMLGSNIDSHIKPIYYKRDVVMTTIAVDTVTVAGNSYSIVMAGTGRNDFDRTKSWKQM